MHRIIDWLARSMALLGGLVLILLIALICVSVLGRSLNTLLHGWLGGLMPGVSDRLLALGVGPINGDFELVEAGVAFAIFAFLPLCQLTSGHAVVDIFTSKLSSRVNRILRMITDIVFAAVLVLIAVQLFDGMLAKLRFGENTFILQFPVWWGYAASFCAAVVAAIVGLYIAAIRIRECLTGKEILL
ncbi:conserved hypothetical protein [Rhodobacteraceae bacterium KLH11]|nr:conserved hypothetical protein [Rhodobacteraceae bacterium KLH11]